MEELPQRSDYTRHAMLKLIQAIQAVRYSLWFVPSAIILASIFLALLAVDADSRVGHDALSQWPRVFGASAEGARGMLQAIASAMITVGALTFSITMLVLSSAASQYTPRVIRTFMRSRTTQAVLGIFLGIFVYCLVVLRTIRGSSESFVPSISVTLAIVLALVGVGLLVYFIHHIASSIQASTIIFTIAEDTIQVIDRTFDAGSDDEAAADKVGIEDEQWFPVAAESSGYLGTIDLRALNEYAAEKQMRMKLHRSTGDFVVAGTALAWTNRKPDAAMEAAVNRRYTVGRYRTVEQDVAVGIQQLVDIALKAMSPAVNDTTTALLCIDYLSAILIRLARCALHPEARDGGLLHLVQQSPPGFSTFLTLAFQQIRVSAAGNYSVYANLLQSLTRIGEATEDEQRRQQVRKQILLVWEYAERELTRPDQRALVMQLLSRGLEGVMD